jgi:hypothetical protein
VNSVETKIKSCRICGDSGLSLLLNLGSLSLTGVFLNPGENDLKAELALAKCTNCNLVQLMHSYPSNLLYGSSYGYESHLNSSMVKHLDAKAIILQKKYLKKENAIIVDIASNDGTLLSAYSGEKFTLIGIDPLMNVVSDRYPKSALKIQDFFSAKSYWDKNSLPADLVTSLSVIYDLENPLEFAKDVWQILSDGGIWHLEQSYLPSMVESTSYDTICHEHLLYLSLHDLKFLLEESGFSLIDATLNSINGGSIAITAKKTSVHIAPDPNIDFILNREIEMGLTNGKMMDEFVKKSFLHKKNLFDLISTYKNAGFEIFGLGASTKGNVLLQWAGLDSTIVKAIGEINPKKFNKVTPGTKIPIVAEKQVLDVDFNSKRLSLVLPWHFKPVIIERAETYLSNGGKLLFPLPAIEVVGN